MNGPQIGIEDFQRLTLKVGTLRTIEPLVADLAEVVVDLDVPVNALAPWACLPAEIMGQRVIVATDLYPFKVAGRRFTATLISLDGALAVVASEIPNGSSLS